MKQDKDLDFILEFMLQADKLKEIERAPFLQFFK